jgi:phosphopantetheinyl transferase (holo-ACP synthase)
MARNKNFKSPPPKLTKRQFFSARSPTESHRKKLLTVRSEPTFDWVYNAVFSHHVLDRSTKTHFHQDGIPSLEKITHLFHANFYLPILHRGAYGEGKITVDEFFEAVTRSPVSKDTIESRRIGPNLVSVIIGRIGVGKSTLMSNVLIRFRRQLRFRKIFPIRVDVESLAGRFALKEEFFKALYAKLYEYLSSSDLIDGKVLQELFSRHEPQYPVHSDELTSKQFAIAARNLIISIYHVTEHRVMLILDNIDKYYYLFDRGGFSEEGDRLRQESMEKLATIVREFMSPDGALDGAGLNVVVCIRRHTLDYLNARRTVLPGRSLNPDEDGSNVFHIRSSAPEDVINSRVQLLTQSLGLTGVKLLRNAAFQSIDALKEVISELRVVKQTTETEARGRSMIADLSRLTSHGHRALIDHFAGYRWAFTDPTILRRFFHAYAPAIITFMLSNNLRYSQVDARFPNLFLVRGDVETASESFVPRRLIQPHRHSYWLKYLMSQYIFHKKSLEQQITPSEILEVFSPNANGNHCYERHVVELILGSLSQVDISAMIEPIFSTSLDGQGLAVRDIRMTDRGKFLIERFAFDFTYLQLVVEDYMLEIPDPIFTDFRYESFDYGYFSDRYDDYKLRTIEQVNSKSRVVFLFLQILEVSLRYEMLRYPLTFAALDAKGVALPNFAEVRRNIVNVVSAIASRINEPSLVQRAKDNAATALTKTRLLEEFFQKAYIDHGV